MSEDIRGIHRRIRDGVIEQLQAVQYAGEQAFNEVASSTKGEFEGYPSVRILPDGFDNQPASTGENDRTVKFAGLLHIEVESAADETSDPQADAIDTMLDLTELFVNTLDQADKNGDLDKDGLNTLQITTKLVDWDFFGAAPGTILICAVRIEVRYSWQLVD